MVDYLRFRLQSEPVITRGVSLDMIRKTAAVGDFKMTNRQRREVDKIFRQSIAKLINKEKPLVNEFSIT